MDGNLSYVKVHEYNPILSIMIRSFMILETEMYSCTSCEDEVAYTVRRVRYHGKGIGPVEFN